MKKGQWSGELPLSILLNDRRRTHAYICSGGCLHSPGLRVCALSIHLLFPAHGDVRIELQSLCVYSSVQVCPGGRLLCDSSFILENEAGTFLQGNSLLIFLSNNISNCFSLSCVFPKTVCCLLTLSLMGSWLRSLPWKIHFYVFFNIYFVYIPTVLI